MKSMVYNMRLTRQDRLLFRNAAEAQGLSIAEYLRRAGREKAALSKRLPASLRYLDELATPAEARANPKKWLRKKALRVAPPSGSVDG